MLERDYQAKLVKKLRKKFKGCIILKNDSGYIQGVPDLLILFKDKWAALEVKSSNNFSKQPNQDFYVRELAAMSYAAFIYPENEKEIFDDLQRAFTS